jgi:endoribonuclease Dicer
LQTYTLSYVTGIWLSSIGPNIHGNPFSGQTLSDIAQMRMDASPLPYRPCEEVVIYDSPPRITETRLYKQLHKLDPSEVSFRRHFKAARYVLSELGACASDLVWRRALLPVAPGVSPFYKNGDDCQMQSEANAGVTKLAIYDLLKNWPFSMPNFDSSSRGYNVTPKFSRLVQILKSCESYGETFRGIVFGLFTCGVY